MRKQFKLSILAITVLLSTIYSNVVIANVETVPQHQTNIIKEGSELQKNNTQDIAIKQINLNYSLNNNLSVNIVEDKVELKQTLQDSLHDKYKNAKEINLVISHYSDLPEENGIYGAVDCKGNKLLYGTIAAPYDIPLGTTFIIEGYECEFTVNDRGSRKYIKWLDNNTIKIDMFIPRKRGESDKEYRQRISDLGLIKTKGKYLISNESEQ